MSGGRKLGALDYTHLPSGLWLQQQQPYSLWMTFEERHRRTHRPSSICQWTTVRMITHPVAHQRVHARCASSALTHHVFFSFRRGYVALAVVSEKEALSRDLNTGLGGDRAGNMVAFAVAALKLVEEFVSKNASQTGKM